MILRALALLGAISACSSVRIEPVMIERGGDGAFHRAMPKEKEGCFWAALQGGGESFTESLFLCCPQGALLVDPVSGPSSTTRPVCTKAVWGR